MIQDDIVRSKVNDIHKKLIKEYEEEHLVECPNTIKIVLKFMALLEYSNKIKEN